MQPFVSKLNLDQTKMHDSFAEPYNFIGNVAVGADRAPSLKIPKI
jgi:hypothetical protein